VPSLKWFRGVVNGKSKERINHVGNQHELSGIRTICAPIDPIEEG
jgi:hypothetical protein